MYYEPHNKQEAYKSGAERIAHAQMLTVAAGPPESSIYLVLEKTEDVYVKDEGNEDLALSRT